MPRPMDGLSQRPAVVLTSLECSGVGKAIELVAGSEFIQRPAVPKITLGGFDAPWIRVHIEGMAR